MRILLDECVDPRVKTLLSGHEVRTVHEMGWDRLLDGALLEACQGNFEILLTIDRGLQHQQNLQRFGVGVIVVRVPKNQLRYYRELQGQLIEALEQVRGGQAIEVKRAGSIDD